MSKGLDLIERQQPEIIDGFPTGNIYTGVTKEELTELGKELKRSEIVETKDFIDLKLLKRCKTHYEYNRQVAIRYDSRGMDIGLLTQEEFDLLKNC